MVATAHTTPPRLSGSSVTHFYRSQTDPLGLFRDIAALGQPVVEVPLGGWLGPYVAVQGEALHEMLVLRPHDFPKETRGQRLLRALLGRGVLTTSGSTWKERRRVVQPAFGRAHLQRYAAIMQRLTDEAVDGFGDRVDLRQQMMRLTLSVACETLFSDGLQGEAAEVDAALGEALEVYNVLLALPFLQPDSRLPFGPPARWRAAKRQLSRVVGSLVDRRRRGPERDDLLGRLLASGLDDEAIRSEVVTMLLAGHETTANGLCWALWELARRPDLQRRARADVLAADEASLAALPQLRGIWNETLRLHPPVWMLARGVREDTELAGVPVKAGTTAFACLHIIHRDPRAWVDPDAFDPDRWTERPTGFFLPFGEGHRKCLGERFAAMEAAIVLATVLRRVHLSPTPDPDPEPQLSVTLRPAGPVPVRVRPVTG
jgi:cytochrome P450